MDLEIEQEIESINDFIVILLKKGKTLRCESNNVIKNSFSPGRAVCVNEGTFFSRPIS